MMTMMMMLMMMMMVQIRTELTITMMIDGKAGNTEDCRNALTHLVPLTLSMMMIFMIVMMIL